MTIRENLSQIKENINNALNRVGRDEEVTLVAVTKTIPPEKISIAIGEGVDIIGENRVQEALEKYSRIDSPVKWHMVGHLQRNKVKHAVQIFSMIQSIDKIETALEIEKRAAKPIDILVEINSSGEQSKSGIHPDELFTLIDRLCQLRKIIIKGLMTIGPFTTEEKKIREAFRLTRKKFEKLQEREKGLNIQFLSMGMSSDYEIAIEEGSNMVRLGTAIFGERR